MKGFINFKEKTLKEITVWAWLGAILPLAGLGVMFCIWAFGLEKYTDILMVIGVSAMFTLSIAWWWWALLIIKNLVSNWDKTVTNVNDVISEIVEVKTLVREKIVKNNK